jgi:hypothetical protein
MQWGSSNWWGIPSMGVSCPRDNAPALLETSEGGSHSQTYLVAPRIKRKRGVVLPGGPRGGQSAEGCACEVGLVVRYGAQHAPPSADPTPPDIRRLYQPWARGKSYPTRPLLAPNLLILRVSGRVQLDGWHEVHRHQLELAYFWQTSKPGQPIRLGAWEVFAAIFACPLFINWKS